MGTALKAIVFDFDGVIADTEPLHYQAILAVLRPAGMTFPYSQYLARYVGYDDRETFRLILGDAERAAEATDARLIELCQCKGDAFAEIVRRGVKPFPGVFELTAAAVAAGLPLAIASGAYGRDIKLVLATLGLAGRFDLIVSADMVARSKPDPETYLRAVAQVASRHPELQLTPANCLAIEDTGAGVAAAVAAGLPTLAVTTNLSPAELGAATRIVPTLSDVSLAQLRQWFA
jgi:beta-phosphoglucomutase